MLELCQSVCAVETACRRLATIGQRKWSWHSRRHSWFKGTRPTTAAAAAPYGGPSLVAYEVVGSALRALHPGLPRARAARDIESVFDRLAIRELALRRLDRMSGGQRQLVGLAQMLVRRPELLLLDEPTSALDLRWQLHVLAAVRDLVVREGAIAMLAMHDLNLALRFADTVVVLGAGGVVAAGPPLEAVTPAVLARAYGIEGRVERCSAGLPVVLVDRAGGTDAVTNP